VTPDFLVDLVGDEDTARTIARVAIIILLIGIPLTVRFFVRFLIRLIKPFYKRFAGEGLGAELAQALDYPLEFIVVVLSLFVGIRLLSEDFSDAFHDSVERLVEILLIFGVFWGLFSTVDAFAAYARRFADDNRNLLNRTVIRFANQIGEAIIVVMGFVVIMRQIGYDLTGILAGLGLTGLAVALAAQDTLANLLGYLVILADVPFRIGDYIEVKGYIGTVEHIGFRTSHIRQPDQSQVVIPNKIFNDAIIKNWSRLRKRQVEIVLELQYDTPPEKVRVVTNEIREALKTHPDIIHDGSEFAQFVEFDDDGSIDLKVLAFMNIVDWAEFQQHKEELQLRILNILGQHRVKRAIPMQVNLVVSSPDYPALSGYNPDPTTETESG
jgi:MscS family membrane protein